MLQFNKEVDYALQWLLALANTKDQEFLSLRLFAKDSHISFLFLQRIAKKLREAEIITAVKGAQGGYRLSRSASKITFKEILSALEGQCALMHCLRVGKVCPKQKICRVHPIFLDINNYLVNYLDKLTLAELLKYEK